MRFIISALLLVVAFLITTQASAFYRPATLSRVASVFAMRDVKVRCYSDEEKQSPATYEAWGYVRRPTAKQHYMAIVDELCKPAKNINNPTIAPQWERALGVLVIVHESYHLRNWGLSSDEAKVECAAIRHWKVGAKLLGASEETVEELWPYALTEHYEEGNIIDWNTGERPYRDDNCNIPPLTPEPES